MQLRDMSWGNVNKLNPRGRYRPNRHWEPAHHKLRYAKQLPIKLPDIERERKLNAMNDPAAIREHFKKMGVVPSSPFQETPVALSSTGAVFDSYVAAEGEAKVAITENAKVRFLIHVACVKKP